MTSRAILLGAAAVLLVAAVLLFGGRGSSNAPRPPSARPSPGATPRPPAEEAAARPATKTGPEPATFAAEVYANMQGTGSMIPEVRLLGPDDWSAIEQYGKDESLSRDERVRLATNAARGEARAKAIREILRAARDSVQRGAAPASLAALLPKLSTEFGADILARYEKLPRSAWSPELAQQVDAAVRAYQMTGRPALEVDAVVVEKISGPRAPAFGFIYGENFFTSGYVTSPEP